MKNTPASFQDVAGLIAKQNPEHLLRFYTIAIETILYRASNDMLREDAQFEAIQVLVFEVNNIMPAFFTGIPDKEVVVLDGLEAIFEMYSYKEHSQAVDYVFHVYSDPKAHPLPDSIHFLNILRQVNNAFADASIKNDVKMLAQ